MQILGFKSNLIGTRVLITSSLPTIWQNTEIILFSIVINIVLVAEMGLLGSTSRCILQYLNFVVFTTRYLCPSHHRGLP